MFGILTHIPWFVGWPFVGAFLATVLCLVYSHWPTWRKLATFVVTIPGWPIVALIWLAYGLMFKNA